VELIGIEPTTS